METKKKADSAPPDGGALHGCLVGPVEGPDLNTWIYASSTRMWSCCRYNSA